MIFPAGYIYELTDTRIASHFPNLKRNNNFTFTSVSTEDYNCVAWINDILDEWVQFYDANGNYDFSLDRYIKYFESYGYLINDNSDKQEGFTKIAISFDKDKNFKHVCKQLPNGEWSSKLGDWEDIKHNNPIDLLGRSYGVDVLFMMKKEN